MTQQPEPTPEEQDQPPERIAEEEAMRYPEFDRDDKLPGDEPPEEPIHES